MSNRNKRETAAKRYQPRRIHTLLVAEAPPDNPSRYFYYEEVDRYDLLFRHVARVVLDSEPKRAAKRAHLEALRKKGVFLIDASPDPLGPSKLSLAVRDLIARIQDLAPCRVILIKVNVYDTAFEPLRRAGLPVVNERIPFPASGNQAKFIEAFRRAYRGRTVKYFAYGSNMKHAEITREDRCPTARFLASAMLRDYRLDFTRHSPTRGGGVADVVFTPGSDVWGGIFEIAEPERCALDDAEGFRGPGCRNAYDRVVMTVLEDGDAHRPVACETYVVSQRGGPFRPSSQYVSLLLDGARDCGLPSEYRTKLRRFGDAAGHTTST